MIESIARKCYRCTYCGLLQCGGRHGSVNYSLSFDSAQYDALLEEQVVALAAERDAEKERHTNNHAAWTAANEELRDAHQRALNERDELQQNIATLQSQLQSVTTSRERCAKENAALAHQLMDTVVQRNEKHTAFVWMDSCYRQAVAERDAARALAAAWKRAAIYEWCITLWPPTFSRTA